MQWDCDGEVQRISLILHFMMKTLKTIHKGSLPLNKSGKGGQDQAHRALGLTFLLDWGADTATPIAGALSSFPTVLVYVALRHTDTYIMRKDRVEMLTLNQYLSWSSHRGTAETNP